MRTTAPQRLSSAGLHNNRIPSLDGLRAIAVAMVIAKHMSSAHLFGPDYLWRLQLGDLGVRIFFVLSGFLITHLLLIERQSGSIDWRSFYWRRTWRIFPAYFFFLSVMALGVSAGAMNGNRFDFIGPALLVANYLPTQNFLSHTWSLSVEEQFYLLWPALLIAFGNRRAMWFAAAFMLVAPLIRSMRPDASAAIQTLWAAFQTAGDAIACGCLLACVRPYLQVHPWLSKVLASPLTTVAAFVTLLPILLTEQLPELWNAFGITALNMVAAVLICSASMLEKRALPYRLLNSRLFRTVGVMSYSLYLWQQPFIYGGMALTMPWSLLATFGVAWCSYRFIEMPALRYAKSWPTAAHAKSAKA